MRTACKTTLVFVLVSCLVVKAQDPFSIALGLGVWAVAINELSKYVYESCDSNWIAFNPTDLEVDLKQKLFGQHIASDIILKAVTDFMNNDNPKKPLVLSLHGWTGTGKSFVSQLIADNVYKRGRDSSFFHFFTAELHFPHASQIKTYKSQLQQWIKGNVTNCGRSMFIFDEMDKMQPGLIDSIKPYLDHHGKLDGVSYRKAIFIFLSNAGGESIAKTALDFWKEGRDPEEMKLEDLETAFNNKQSGLWHTSLIEKKLVDFFVPFLPLKYRHVVQCVKAEMFARGMKPNPDVADKFARDMAYFPESERVFAVKGCKTVQNRLDFYI